MSKTHQVNLNIDEAKNFLSHIIKNNRFLAEQNKKPVAVEIIGDSGIGKTSMALQITEELDLNYVKLNLAQIEELGDLIGYPIRQFQLCKPSSTSNIGHKEVTVMERKMVEEIQYKTISKQVLIAGKLEMREIQKEFPVMVEKEVAVTKLVDTLEEVTEECLWIDEHAIESYTNQGYEFTGEKRMSYCPPEWIADKKGGGILILDDWNRADLRFIQAIMELIDRGEYISWKLPEDWHIILTANPDDGEYLVQSIDTAQRTRFISINLKFSSDIWAKWAEKKSIDNRCINFLLLHEELVTSQTNARAITNFFNSISSIEDFSKSLPLIQMIGEGSVGIEFTTMFTSFIHNKLDMIIHPKDVLLNEDEDLIVKELKKLVGKDHTYRADIASIITTRIINYALSYSEDNPITKSIISRLIILSTDEDILNNDLQFHLVKKLLAGNKIKFQKIMENASVLKMATKL